MIRRASIVLAAVMVLGGAACGSDDGDDQEAFSLTGRVAAVEPAAQPANDPTDGNITGAIVLRVPAPAGCQAEANGVRIYVDEDTSFTPTSASGDLQALEGETVNASGSMTKDGDTCTPVAVSVNAQSDVETTPGATGEGSGDTGGTGDTSDGAASTGSPSATSSPNDPDDEGSISDTEEEASPAPDDPDDEGVVPQP